MSSKVMLTEYFQAVDRRLEREGLMPQAGFRVKVCGETVDLRFASEEVAQIGRMSLEGFVTDAQEPANASLMYWYEQCDAYLPEGEGKKSAVWYSTDATGELHVGTDRNRMIGSDFSRRRFYLAQDVPPVVDHTVYGHTLPGLFSRWADTAGKILVHAAAVGTDGKGVLIVGRSGSGKSTFSISCLTAGLDFVSDDYALLTDSGPLYAMPLYSNVAINPDMYQQLPRLEGKGEPETVPRGDGKLLLRLREEQICPKLEIKAVIMPRVTGQEEPSIALSAQGAAMTQLIHSSIHQLERYRDTKLIQKMAMRLGRLPAYEMSMSTDLRKNPAFLRSFIEKEF